MTVRIIPRLDIKGPNLVKGINLEGLRILGEPDYFAALDVRYRYIHIDGGNGRSERLIAVAKRKGRGTEPVETVFMLTRSPLTQGRCCSLSAISSAIS